MTPDWLPLPSKEIEAGVYEIHVTGFGPAEVGAYGRLKNWRKGQRGIQRHHIVGNEHLQLLPTRYTHHSAPAIVLDRESHAAISEAIDIEVEYMEGSRHGGRYYPTRAEALRLFRAVYTEHTPFRTLYLIARCILS